MNKEVNQMQQFECLGGGFKFYQLKSREQRSKNVQIYHTKGVNYNLEDKQVFVQILIDILLIELELEREKQIFYQQFGQSDYAKSLIKIFDDNGNNSIQKNEIGSGLKAMGVFNVQQEDIDLIVKRYGVTQRIDYFEFRKMILPYKTQLNQEQEKDLPLQALQQSGMQTIFKKILNVEVSIEQLKKEMYDQKIDLQKIFNSINQGNSFDNATLLQYLQRYDKKGKMRWNAFDEKKMELLIERMNSGTSDQVAWNEFQKSFEFNDKNNDDNN